MILSFEKEEVKQINATNDGSFLWVLTDKMGYLYRSEGGEYEEYETYVTKSFRNYGNNEKQYYEYDPSTCRGILYPSNHYVNDGCQAVFNSDDEPTFLNKGGGTQIRLIDWEVKIL